MRTSRLLASLSLTTLAAVASLPACSSSTTANTTSTSVSSGTGPSSSHAATSSSHASSGVGGGGVGGSTSSLGSGGSIVVCPPLMKYGGGETATSTNEAKAKIVDETGAPIAAGQPVYICGIDICSNPSNTDATGSASISSTLSMKKAAFKVGDTVSYAEIAIPLTSPTNDFTAGGTKVLQTAKFTGKTGAQLGPGTVTSGDVSLDIAANTSIGINLIVYTTPDSQLFRAVSIPLTNAGPWLASSGKTDFALLYGVAPVETTLCPAVKVTVQLPHATMQPNDLGWAAGAAVEFWTTTVDTGQTYAPYAGWAKASGGTVSADGKSISTTDGFIVLEHFAVRLAN